MSSAGGGLFSERKNIFLAFLEQTKYLGKTVSAKSDQITAFRDKQTVTDKASGRACWNSEAP